MTDPALSMEPAEGPEVDDEVFQAVLGEAVDAIDACGVRYLLIGGIASAVLGRPRWTGNVDVFVVPRDARPALGSLEKAGFKTEETYPDWLFRAFKDEVVVDIVFRSAGGVTLDDEMVERSVVGDFKGRDVRVMSAEDLLVMKAVAHDEHMPRHWHDALGLISGCEMDWDYVVRRAKQYGARRVLSLLVYAQSNDLIVPMPPVRALFDAIFET
jgi:hypothetical protein